MRWSEGYHVRRERRVVGRCGRCARTMDGSEGFALVKDIRKEEGDEAKDDQDDSNGGGIR